MESQTASSCIQVLLEIARGTSHRASIQKTLSDICGSVERYFAPRHLAALLVEPDTGDLTFCHVFGDKVIRAIATILRDNVKGKDLAARYGGEEFVIILPDTPLAGAGSLAESIRRTVEGSRIKRTGTNEIIANVTISLGVARHRPGESDRELLARADQALYQSKQQGRNRVTVAAAA